MTALAEHLYEVWRTSITPKRKAWGLLDAAERGRWLSVASAVEELRDDWSLAK